jgi:hypothetical protein
MQQINKVVSELNQKAPCQLGEFIGRGLIEEKFGVKPIKKSY